MVSKWAAAGNSANRSPLMPSHETAPKPECYDGKQSQKNKAFVIGTTRCAIVFEFFVEALNLVLTILGSSNPLFISTFSARTLDSSLIPQKVERQLLNADDRPMDTMPDTIEALNDSRSDSVNREFTTGHPPISTNMVIEFKVINQTLHRSTKFRR